MTIEGDIKTDASGKPTHVFLGGEWRALPKTVEEQLSEAKAEIERLRAFIDLIRAEVLEEAAGVCDEHAARYEADIPDGDRNDGLAETVAASLRGRAAAIRALKDKGDA